MTKAERALLIAIAHAVATRILDTGTYRYLQDAIKAVEHEACK